MDLRPQCPPVYHQGHLDSCTANAIGAALQFAQMRQGQRAFKPSRLFIYYIERQLENTVKRDAGAMLRSGIKGVRRWGAPPEYPHWPYLHHRFPVRPPKQVYAVASRHQTKGYQAVRQDLRHLKASLAEGSPFVLGMAVFDSFRGKAVARTGRLSMPKRDEGDRGGHAVMAVGYNDASERFILRNSWGPRWGMAGYFTVPYAYLLDENYAANFWTIQLVE
jgi:C1A family cysteine protease